MKNIPILTILLLILGACTVAKSPFGFTSGDQQIKPLATLKVPSCDLAPIEVPTLPSVIPGYAQLDEATGLHMTGKVQVIDFSSYRLLVTGLVEQPLSLHYDDLRCLPKVTASPKLICPGVFEDVAKWSGVPIYEVLQLARPQPQARSVSLISADGFKMDIDLEKALNHENFLAYELEGKPLPVLHGFPLRAIFPSMDGSHWVKWLVEIKVK
jgi:DMSO/TMAO reductase YedYZ molybdopterin-dependent catalytic subunit